MAPRSARFSANPGNSSWEEFACEEFVPSEASNSSWDEFVPEAFAEAKADLADIEKQARSALR